MRQLLPSVGKFIKTQMQQKLKVFYIPPTRIREPMKTRAFAFSSFSLFTFCSGANLLYPPMTENESKNKHSWQGIMKNLTQTFFQLPFLAQLMLYTVQYCIGRHNFFLGSQKSFRAEKTKKNQYLKLSTITYSGR